MPLDTYPEDAEQSIITGFGVYGKYHLIQAVFAWLIVFRWRALIPIFLLVVGIDQLLGIILINWKPLPVTPPGEIGAYLLFPITLAAFLLSVRQSK